MATSNDVPYVSPAVRQALDHARYGGGYTRRGEDHLDLGVLDYYYNRRKDGWSADGILVHVYKVATALVEREEQVLHDEEMVRLRGAAP